MDSKNTIAAIALSSAVIVLWALFFVPEKSTVDQNIVEKEKIEQSGDAPSLEQKETQITISRDDALKQNERIQFGRPIGKFQAIQQDLAVLSTHVAASSVAADYACSSMDKGNPDFAIAVAKSRIDDAVSVGAGIAHQVHGAIGFTYEHGLHFATRRLWAWRAEYGSGSEWSKILGEKAISNGADKFWPSITEGNLDI